MIKYNSFITHYVQKYNPKRYWNFRNKVINSHLQICRFKKLIMLFYIKYCDAHNNASMGTYIDEGAYFKTPPKLPHGLNGIIINRKACIGENCTIFQQVTIGEKRGEAPSIGDNCIIGSGAKIIGGCKIGNNVTIGANTVVTKDIPDNMVVVGAAMRMIPKM